MTITNIRTKVQFTQYGEVKCFIVNANKLRAMNIIKSVFGVKSLSSIKWLKQITINSLAIITGMIF
jgi:hypothetical protein